MNSPSIILKSSKPQYGVVNVYGAMPAEGKKYLEELITGVHRFQVVYHDDCSEYGMTAARLNVANLGTDARLILLTPGWREFLLSTQYFVECLKDVFDNECGDRIINLRRDRPRDVSYSIGVQEVCAEPKSIKNCEIEHSRPSNCDANLCLKAEDWYDWELDGITVEDPYQGLKDECEDLVENQEIERDRRKDLENIEHLILDYVTKYHADPTPALQEFIKGKIVLNPTALSRIVVNGDARIVLSDYNETEIKMGARERSLYILFLKHPEGMRQSDVADYRRELVEIYGIVKPGASDNVVQVTIDNLCDPFSDALRQSISKIKNAVTYVIRDSSKAADYYIKGERGGVYRIGLSREMVKLPSAFTD